MDEIATILGTKERTIRVWANGLGLRQRSKAPKGRAEADPAVVAKLVDDARSQALALSQAKDDPASRPLWFPGDDPEIRAEIDDLITQAQTMKNKADLAAIQRRISRLSLLLNLRLSQRLRGEAATVVIDALNRALLYNRRVDAEVPDAEVDQQQLRREAATQLMREVRSVLDEREQQVFGTLLKEAARRLSQRQAQRAAAPAPAAGPEEDGVDA